MAPTLWIITKDSYPVRKIEARIGLRTYAGIIVRVSAKSIWTRGKDGHARLHRSYDGRLPSIYESQAPKA